MIALVLVACSDGSPTDDAAYLYVSTVEPLLMQRCVACHSPADTSLLVCSCQLDLSGHLTKPMINVLSTQSTAMDYIEPGDHLYSYLWHKLNGTQSIADGSGTSMPLGGVLTEMEIDAVADWIDAGALVGAPE